MSNSKNIDHNPLDAKLSTVESLRSNDELGYDPLALLDSDDEGVDELTIKSGLADPAGAHHQHQQSHNKLQKIHELQSAITPPLRRTCILIASLFENLVFSGIIFGWPALFYMLKNEQIYASLCTIRTLSGSVVGVSRDVAAGWNGSNVTNELVVDETVALTKIEGSPLDVMQVCCGKVFQLN